MQRKALTDVIDTDLSLKTVMHVICQTVEAWTAFVQFCGAVMLEKKNRERERQAREAQMIAARANGSDSQHDVSDD